MSIFELHTFGSGEIFNLHQIKQLTIKIHVVFLLNIYNSTFHILHCLFSLLNFINFYIIFILSTIHPCYLFFLLYICICITFSSLPIYLPSYYKIKCLISKHILFHILCLCALDNGYPLISDRFQQFSIF